VRRAVVTYVAPIHYNCVCRAFDAPAPEPARAASGAADAGSAAPPRARSSLGPASATPPRAPSSHGPATVRPDVPPAMAAAASASHAVQHAVPAVA
jgi:hypothetical protein